MGGLNSDRLLSAPPYRFALQTEADGASGERELKAIGVRVGEKVYSTAITIDVERSDEPERLRTEESSISIGSVGEQTALSITGAAANPGCSCHALPNFGLALADGDYSIGRKSGFGLLSAAWPGDLDLFYLRGSA